MLRIVCTWYEICGIKDYNTCWIWTLLYFHINSTGIILRKSILTCISSFVKTSYSDMDEQVWTWSAANNMHEFKLSHASSCVWYQMKEEKMPLIIKHTVWLNLARQWRYLTDETGFLFIGTHCTVLRIVCTWYEIFTTHAESDFIIFYRPNRLTATFESN